MAGGREGKKTKASPLKKKLHKNESLQAQGCSNSFIYLAFSSPQPLRLVSRYCNTHFKIVHVMTT
jgi:hypothetical protein